MGFYDEAGNIRTELLDEKAQDQAKEFVVYHFDKKKQREELDERRSLSPPFLSLCLKSGFELHYMV